MNPEDEKIAVEGLLAFRRGEEAESNPYKLYEPGFYYWSMGWEMASKQRGNHK